MLSILPMPQYLDPNKLRTIMPPPVEVRHSEYSLLLSADDEPFPPSDYLLALGLDAAEHARKLSLSDIGARDSSGRCLIDVWPGEHYRLLAGLVLTLNPRVVVEIGTATGLSALAFKKYLRKDGRIITFDLVPWKETKGSYLTDEDFQDERLIQYVDDLSNPLTLPLYYEILKKADLIFVDAAKDGVSEDRFIANLSSITYEGRPVVVFDDIRLWNMIGTWRKLKRPKLDITSFGHWSGTGLVDWMAS